MRLTFDPKSGTTIQIALRVYEIRRAGKGISAMIALHGLKIDGQRIAMRRLARFAVAACALYGALTVLDAPASSQTFPGRTITIIVPYPPGGTTDVAARALSVPLGLTLGQNVIVENVSGGSALIGAGPSPA